MTLITSSPFWIPGNGLSSRVREMVRFLARHHALTVAYLNPLTQGELGLLQALGDSFNLHVLGDASRPLAPAEYIERFRQQPGAANGTDIAIIVQTELSYMLDALPAGCKVFLDTIDLISDRTSSMAQHQVQDHFPLTRESEIALLSRYDRVICIQESEYTRVAEWLGKSRAILAPHPVVAAALPIRPVAVTAGFVASRWHANIDGLKWFLEAVWPRLPDAGLRLDVFGFVADIFRQNQLPNVGFHGFVDDLTACYAGMDIAINPVRYGAGLKIKTVEALAHGLPLVTTKQGASGLEHLAGKAFLLADDDEAFAHAIRRLATDHALRQSISRFAHHEMARSFGPDQCFGALAEQIECLAAH